MHVHICAMRYDLLRSRWRTSMQQGTSHPEQLSMMTNEEENDNKNSTNLRQHSFMACRGDHGEHYVWCGIGGTLKMFVLSSAPHFILSIGRKCLLD